MARDFKTVERGKFITLGESVDDSGDVIKVIEGTLKEVDSVQFSNGVVNRYELETDEGEKIGVLGATILDDLMGTVNPGQYVRITVKDEKIRTKSGMKMKDFVVEIAE